ncbi:MAG: CHAT domain-containing protein, partial [Pseudomonadota bacterium]
MLGRDKLMRYLALLDFTASRKDHMKIVSDWPGALQMLPAERDDLFETSGWSTLAEADPDGKWIKPDDDTLRVADKFRSLIKDAPIDPERMFYIAGQADTYSGMTIEAGDEEDEEIRFQISPEGDGQVLWSTGIPDGIKAWYTPAVHGDLARYKPAFPAILDILERGTTDKLPKEKPAVSRSRHLSASIAREPIALVPSEDHLLAAATGSSLAFEPTSEERQVAIEVTHGHLAFAKYPVMVGHYIGDSLNGTERVLDRRQSGRIAKRRELGLHPGPIGTNDVHLNDRQQPTGSIIVGLGVISDLTSGKLQQTVQQGLLELAATMREERQKQLKGKALAETPKPRGVSCVLVGTGGGVVAVPDCIVAILRAMKNANRLLGDDGFAHLEIIELIEQRAVGAWHAIQNWLERAEFEEIFSLDQPIRESRGGQRRAGLDNDPLWWTPVTITAVDDGSPDSENRPTNWQALKYVAIAGRARAEADLVAHQRSLVERYVKRITGRRVEGGDASPARTLFELLWPNRLKEQSLDDRNLRLILDESSAALPWEMMDDRRPWTGASGGDREKNFGPPVTRFGVIRQLIAMNFRSNTPNVNGSKALVVGDPRGEKSGLAELPGAEKEAESVAAALHARGYDVTKLIGKNVQPEDVISQLFSQAWQVVHIAAHGVVDYAFEDDPLFEKKTGVVLGGSMVLDADLLEQMPVPPDLFFVNCCLLGKIDPGEEIDHLRRNRPALASSVAVQLIKMGVRAVVAAGWEVGDDSAELFAKELYAGLLDGRSFGEVTKHARNAVYENFRSDSTWGAYQCYGHPDFQLHALQTGLRHDEKRPVFASPSEAMAAVERITSMGEVGGERDEEADLEKLEEVRKVITERAWLGHAALRAALADAYASLNKFDLAIDHYTEAALAEDASVPVRAIEQRLNLMSRRVGDAPNQDEDQRKKSAMQIKDVIEKLEKLIDVFGRTQERLALVGSAHNRMAQLTSGTDRTAHLDSMQAYYLDARQHGQKAGLANVFYPWCQELCAEVALKLRTRRRIKPDFTGVKKLPPSGAQDDFWRLVLPADLLLLERATDEKLSDADLDDILNAYLDAWNHVGSQRELSSIFGQIDFLRRMLDDKTASSPRLRAFA